jgi:glycosyltransferase involved in cell wall biosynthesis
MTAWVSDTYNVFRAAAASGKSKNRFDQLEGVRANFDEACRLFATMAPTEEAANARRELNAQRETSKAEVDTATAQRPLRDGQAGAISPKAVDVSIVVVVHNMAREAPRTLHSLSPSYQQGINADDYEIIVIDNGSSPPFDAKVLDGLGGNFRLVRIDSAPPSPVQAVNRGLAEARGRVIGVMIDGARMVTPGFIHFARQGVRLYPRAVVATLGWYLGRDQQRWAMESGYDQKQEDELLASIGWPRDGYRLFEIAAFDESSTDGWFAPISETNGLFLSRKSWDLLGGVDERFDAAGGGFVNLDTLTRALELPDSELVILLGEATFHQLHGGIATNADYRSFPAKLAKWQAQYEAIRGHSMKIPSPENRTYLGVLPPAALPHFARSIVEPARGLPLGPSFDRNLWSNSPSPRPADPVCGALLDLAENEFRQRHFEAAAAVARMARNHAPDEPGPQRLLAIAGAWLHGPSPSDDRRAAFHFARARAHRLLGDISAAQAEFRAALSWNADFSEAHSGLADLRFPGEDYLHWLAWLQATLAPNTYLEIGVWRGQSLALARPPTCAIGVDPQPMIEQKFLTETHIFVETSDEFFTRHRLERVLGGGSLDFVFIDGLHLFQQALTDFINVERWCNRRSVLVLHDTIPLDEQTQRRTKETTFYTGDVWKTVLSLRFFRPDLDIFTIATAPTGLTVVTNLDPSSRVLTDRYDEAVRQFADMPFSELELHRNEMLSVVANDWASVERRLNRRSLLPISSQPLPLTNELSLKGA